jgi:hypothetical protein
MYLEELRKATKRPNRAYIISAKPAFTFLVFPVPALELQCSQGDSLMLRLGLLSVLLGPTGLGVGWRFTDAPTWIAFFPY